MDKQNSKTKKFFSGNPGTLFSAVLSVVFLLPFSGQMAPYIDGVSPYYASLSQLEERVFTRAERARKTQISQYNESMKETIRQVMAKFYTGLDEKKMNQIPEWIMSESIKNGHDPLFLTALIVTESSFNNWARSKQGALGLMQIRPRTGLALAEETQIRWKGSRSLYDPSVNIALGAYYLKKLLSRFSALDLALEAYNHGPSKLSRYLRKGHQPKRYSEKVMKIYQSIRSKSI